MTCAKSHPGICSPLIHSIVSNDSVSRQQRPWSDCAYAVHTCSEDIFSLDGIKCKKRRSKKTRFYSNEIQNNIYVVFSPIFIKKKKKKKKKKNILELHLDKCLNEKVGFAIA